MENIVYVYSNEQEPTDHLLQVRVGFLNIPKPANRLWEMTIMFHWCFHSFIWIFPSDSIRKEKK